MALTEQDVDHVARLARLALTPEERAAALVQLGRVLDHIRRLEACDTRNVPPTGHAVPLVNVWREDEPRPFGDIPALLANAPDREDVFFRVKRVME